MVKKARETLPTWSEMKLENRIEIMKKLVLLLEQNKPLLAKTIHEEVGKPFRKAEIEVEDSIKETKFFLENVPIALKEAVLKEKDVLCFEPIGVVTAITPWNFPLEMLVVSVIPALLAGNTVLLKPSEHSTLVAIEFFNLLEQLEGLPKNTIQLIVGGKETGKALVEQDIDLVYFTGSLRAGKQIMRDSAEKLHKIILELGGKDPSIVLKDADLETTAKGIVKGATSNTGQVCCSIERVYIQKEIFESLTQKIVEEAKKVSIDHGDNKNADIGPLIRAFQLKTVQEHIKDAEQKGAHILTGGKRLEGKGYFFPPTVITNITEEMLVLKEETFGPVIPLIPFETIEEVIQKANDSKYGLTASIWTKDQKKAREIARKIVTGTVVINDWGGYKMGCPWGGAKQSGIGRGNHIEGIRALTNQKHLAL
ncbi:aldehyde dehydrogenase family protein [Candidatus Micrarchaeota archaeon]|nr:aldehyde dehydrogenase family protein [Candidatus Micrarchaeota archaeon]